jgi:hypothetical protein
MAAWVNEASELMNASPELDDVTGNGGTIAANCILHGSLALAPSSILPAKSGLMHQQVGRDEQTNESSMRAIKQAAGD